MSEVPLQLKCAGSHQPVEQDQIAFFRALICMTLAGIRRLVVQVKAIEQDNLIAF